MVERAVCRRIVQVSLFALLACKSDSAAESGTAGATGEQAGAHASAADGGQAGDQASDKAGAGHGGQSARAGKDAAGADADSAGMSEGRAGTSGGHGGAAAGSGGVAGSDPQSFFGASRCTASLLLCDGFEAAALDKSVWQTKFAAPTLDKTRAARGTQSLHFSTNATGAAGVEVSKIFPTANNNYYGRMFVYFDALHG